MPRGKPKDCTQCGRRHWSPEQDLCPRCRNVFPSKLSRYVPKPKVLDHDLATGPAVIRTGAGKCLGRLGAPAAADRRCLIHWRHLSHRHCASLGCGRPMGIQALACGACMALEVLERYIARLFEPDELSYTDRARSEYLADMQGMPGAIAL